MPSLGLIIEATLVMVVLMLISVKAGFVDPGGLISSFVVGYTIYIFGDKLFFVPLLIFYVIAGLMTKLRYEEKRLKGAAEEKLGARGWKNVLANGGVATVIVCIAAYNNNMLRPELLAAYLGAISTAYADTLATEIGLLYPREPRLITNMKTVPAGMPGAVSPYGTAAQLLSAFTIVPATVLFLPIGDKLTAIFNLLAIVLISSFLGSTFDSIIGATAQAVYRCKLCGKITEKKVHCGAEAQLLRGIKYVDNNVVNLIATIIGAAIAYILVYSGTLRIV
ncbi:MAG: DUF92 domain-containing protein [Nitrososphaerota archaeon]|nr:DUF92 domain-containing protein [Aigarchaeota archaeon]MDW8076853.1 DUF92 domain-containing protein [Nitrososphaerota archaeon]